MRIKIKTKAEYLAEFDQWEVWFAWHPVQVDGAIVWLETVRRRRWASWGEDGWTYKNV